MLFEIGVGCCVSSGVFGVRICPGIVAKNHVAIGAEFCHSRSIGTRKQPRFGVGEAKSFGDFEDIERNQATLDADRTRRIEADDDLFLRECRH